MGRLKSPIAILACTLALLTPVATRAAEPAEKGPVIDSVLGAVEWAPLVTTLASKGAIYSTFTEQRWFGFKKTPVELKGELRYSPDQGLCLNYTGADAKMVILDSQGVLLRDAKGRQKAAPNDAKVSDLIRSVLTIMEMDLEQLRQTYQLHGVRKEADWRLDFEPRNKELAKTLGTITVFGAQEDVKHLVFRRGSTARVEIFITATRSVQAFNADERKRYFR